VPYLPIREIAEAPDPIQAMQALEEEGDLPEEVAAPWAEYQAACRDAAADIGDARNALLRRVRDLAAREDF
jgi:hypothetical protein